MCSGWPLMTVTKKNRYQHLFMLDIFWQEIRGVLLSIKFWINSHWQKRQFFCLCWTVEKRQWGQNWDVTQTEPEHNSSLYVGRKALFVWHGSERSTVLCMLFKLVLLNGMQSLDCNVWTDRRHGEETTVKKGSLTFLFMS